MRSHAIRALAALCATSALLACGESVDVGNFDDGTGGTGGGGLATSGGAGGGSTTTASSGTTSTTTTSSGTPSTSSSGGATSCADLGGQCLSDPGNPGFPALCEGIGMVPLDGECAGINEGCCGATPTCDADAECSPDKLCDPCAHGSCPECDDCVSACVPHACDPGGEPACDMNRPDCGDGRTAVVRDGCYVCVELGTCEPPPAPTPCESDGQCASTELCDPCASSSCPECDDCIAGCVPHECDPGSEPACDMARPDCGFGRTAVVRDGCYVCVDLETCEPALPCGGIGGLECADDAFCDFPNDICGGDDGLGVCRPRPTDCPEPNADEVVCGCDFDTYGSECLANQAGVDLSSNDPLECGGA